MWLNITIGFIIPWLFAVPLIIKNNKLFKKTLLTMFPIGAMIAFVFDTLGMAFNFWRVVPILDVKLVATLPAHLGLYPIALSYMIYLILLINKTKIVISVFSVSITIVEYFFVLGGRVFYYNGWNIGWTFASYVFAFSLGYVYYYQLMKTE